MILQGKSALVTGSGRGIGRAIALEFAKEGADVLVNDVNEEAAQKVVEEIRAMGRDGISYKADVSREEEVIGMFRTAIDHFGKLDILVNNAGNAARAMLHKMSVEMWDSVIGTHLRGSFLCMREAAKHMIERNQGKILCVVSVAGFQGTIGQANYAAAKGGMIGLVKSAAKELSRNNIIVNAVSLGAVSSDMTSKILSDEKLREMTLSRILLRKIFEPEEVAPIFAFLASNAANGIQGQVIAADGGIAGLG
jgi:3-oxoacyl-[acyl-carrier protein] reductase